MFLSLSDLVALTGLTRPGAQCRWLREHGYRHDRDVQGRPVVLRAEVERHLLSGSRTQREPQVRIAP